MKRWGFGLLLAIAVWSCGEDPPEAPPEAQREESPPVPIVEAADLNPVIAPVGPQGALPQTLVVELARPVVAADRVGTEAEGFVIESTPPLEGRATFTSPSTISFEPSSPLLPGVQYTLRVAQIPTAGGERKPERDEDWRHTLDTPSFDFLRMVVDDFDYRRGTVHVELRFSAPVDLASVRQRVRFFATDESGRERSVYLRGSELSTPSTVLAKLHNNGFRSGQTVRLELAEGAHHAADESSSSVAHRASVQLPSGDAVVQIREVFPVEGSGGFLLEVVCDDGAVEESRYYYNRSVGRGFGRLSSRCLLDDDFVDRIRLEPAVPFTVAPSGGGFRIFGDFARGAYSIRIESGARTVDGGELVHEYERSFSIPALSPMVSFVSQGRYLPRAAWSSLPVRHRNLGEIEVSVRHVPPQNLVFWLSDPSSEAATLRTSDLIARHGFPVDGEPDVTSTSHLDVGSLIPADTKGLVELTLRNGSTTAAARIVLTDLQLIAKRTAPDEDHPWGRSVSVWAFDAHSLEPVSSVDIQLVRQSGKIEAHGRTRVDGAVHLNLPPQGLDPAVPFALIARRDDDLTFLEFEDLQTEVQETRVAGEPYRSEEKYRAAIYADRGVYRPGETAHLVTVLRGDDLLAPPPELPVLLRVIDPRGQIVREDLIPTNEAGVAPIDVAFADFADTGTWTLEAVTGETSVARHEFLVEEFVPERLEVEASTGADGYLLGQATEVDVRARYLFGGVPADHRVELSCELEAGTFSPSSHPSYTFSVWSPDEGSDRRTEIGRAAGTLDGEGESRLTCPAPAGAGGFAGPGQLIARAAVFESGSGRTTVGRTVVPIHPAPYYLGLQSNTDSVAVGEQLRIEGVVVDWTGGPEESVEQVEVELLRLEEEYGWYYDENLGHETYRRYLRPVPEETRTVPVTEAGFELEWSPTTYARAYLVRATHGDARTDLRVDGKGGWYYWRPQQTSQQRTPRPDRATWLEIQAPQRVTVGDEVSLSFEAPYRGRVLLTAETDELLHAEWREVEPGVVDWTFPLERFEPNVYVTALAVKDPHLDSAEAYLPDRSFGVTSIEVEPTELTADLRLEAPDEVRTRSRLDIELDLGPLEAPTWVTVAAVDEGILSLTGFESPDPLRTILATRALGVDTFETVGWSLVVPPGSPQSTAGGDAGAGLGRVQPIDPVALWSGLVRVPEHGRARVTFDLPTYQGALRVMAVSASGKRLGHADQRVVVRDPIVLQTTLPRFLSPGDRARIPVFLTNLSGSDRSIEVGMEIEPLDVGGDVGGLETPPAVTLSGPATRTVTLGDGEQGQVLFDLTAGSGLGAVRLTTTLTSGDFESFESSPVVLRAAEPETRRTQRVALEAGILDLAPLLEGWEPLTEHSTFWVTDNPYGEAFDHLSWLIRYPYGCIEQTISSTRPLLAVPKLLQRVAPDLVDPTEIDDKVQSGIGRILSMQTPAGGFAYWPGGTDPAHWGTANAIHLLLDARDARHPVPQGRIDRAIEWVERELTHQYGRGRQLTGYRSTGAEAYLHFVLAKAGKGRKARILERIQELGSPDGGWEREQLYMLQAALYMAGDHRYESALRDPDVSSVGWDRRNGWSFYSDRRRRGFMLATYVDLFGRGSEIEPLVNLVAESLRGPRGRYTTQEVVWSTTGLGKYVDGLAAEFAPPVLRANGRVLEPDVVPEKVDPDREERVSDRTWSLYRASEYGDLTLELPSKAEGNVYLVLSSEGIRRPPETAYGQQGLHLERRYLDPEGNPLGSSPTVELGAVVYVELTLRNDSPERISNLALVDRVPAGWEIENPRLGRGGEVDWFDPENAWDLDHMNLRDDRLEVFGHLEVDESRRVLYAVRAVTAGRFVLPPAEAEAMYDPTRWARLPGGRVQVDGPWSP